MSADLHVDRIEIEDRASWLALRAGDVTASDVAAVLGVDDYRTPARVYAEKTGAIAPPDDNTLMRRGRWFEAAAVAALGEERPTWDVKRAGVYLRAPALGIGATPDAVATRPDRAGFGIVQIKVVAEPVFREKWCGGDIERPPLGYQLQTITEGRLAKADWTCVAALIVGTFSAELKLFDVDHGHEPSWTRIVEGVNLFRDYIAAGQMPPLLADRDAETVKALFRREDDAEPPKNLPADLLSTLERREDLRAQIKDASEAVEAIDTTIKAALGNSSVGLLAPYRVGWKVEPRKSYTVAASEPRVLRITKPKGRARG